MKALSVKNPYAYHISTGEKTIELRSRPTSHRGELLICSSKKARMNTYISYQKEFWRVPDGVAMAVVNIIDCRPATIDDVENAWASEDDIEGMFAWVLENVKDTKPTPIFGKLNFFEVPDENIEFLGDELDIDYYQKEKLTDKDYIHHY